MLAHVEPENTMGTFGFHRAVSGVQYAMPRYFYARKSSSATQRRARARRLGQLRRSAQGNASCCNICRPMLSPIVQWEQLVFTIQFSALSRPCPRVSARASRRRLRDGARALAGPAAALGARQRTMLRNMPTHDEPENTMGTVGFQHLVFGVKFAIP